MVHWGGKKSCNQTIKLFFSRINVCVLKVKRLAAAEIKFQNTSTSQVYCKQMLFFWNCHASGLTPDLEGQLNQLQKEKPSVTLEQSGLLLNITVIKRTLYQGLLLQQISYRWQITDWTLSDFPPLIFITKIIFSEINFILKKKIQQGMSLEDFAMLNSNPLLMCENQEDTAQSGN